MRFGIKAGQMKSLMPPEGSVEALRKYISEFEHASLVGKMADHGFNLIELGGDLVLFFPHSYSPESIKQLAKIKRERQLSYTVHLPLWSVEPSTSLPSVRAGSVQAVVDCIRATLPLEPESYVLHATGTLATEFSHKRPESLRAVFLQIFQENALESLRQILQATGIPSRLLAIETIEFPFELTVQMAEALDLSMCLDTGHVLAGFAGPVELFDVLERVLPRLGEVHLHDAPWQGPERNIGYGKDHQALGKGDLDVGRFLDRLAAAGWAGPVIFELTIEQALASLNVIHSLRPHLISKESDSPRRDDIDDEK